MSINKHPNTIFLHPNPQGILIFQSAQEAGELIERARGGLFIQLLCYPPPPPPATTTTTGLIRRELIQGGFLSEGVRYSLNHCGTGSVRVSRLL